VSQKGNIGLMAAANKYDWRLGYRFATYANSWIRQAVGRAFADQSRTVRLPGHRTESLARLARARQRLAQRLGREPALPELAQYLETSVEQVEALMLWARAVISLDAPRGEEGEVTLLDVMANTDAELPSAAVMATELETQAREQLSTLSPREQEVLAMRFGIDRGGERTLAEIGARLGVSRERIRQIEARALSKLRHPSRANALRRLVGSGAAS
jgi:RNA polymerase primary sigma factor